jgi:molybdopterin converting factor subunit 1
MTITVLFFAAVRDLVGKDEERLTVPAGVDTMAALASHLIRLYPALEDRIGHVRFARNEAFADLADAIADGDEIALLPPVSGG